jgi:hypothetical protein
VAASDVAWLLGRAEEAIARVVNDASRSKADADAMLQELETRFVTLKEDAQSLSAERDQYRDESQQRSACCVGWMAQSGALLQCTLSPLCLMVDVGALWVHPVFGCMQWAPWGGGGVFYGSWGTFSHAERSWAPLPTPTPSPHPEHLCVGAFEQMVHLGWAVCGVTVLVGRGAGGQAVAAGGGFEAGGGGQGGPVPDG